MLGAQVINGISCAAASLGCDQCWFWPRRGLWDFACLRFLASLGVGFERSASAVVSSNLVGLVRVWRWFRLPSAAAVLLVLVGLACAWCWFWSVRGCGLLGSLLASVLAAAVVSLTLVSGCVRCLFWSLGVSGGEGSGIIITKKNPFREKESN